MFFPRIIALTAIALSVASGAVEAAQPGKRLCLSPAETLEAVASGPLAEPRRTLREAAESARAEALGARLCRWDDDLVYEITLLRQDGRVLFVYVDASSGKAVGSSRKD